jgi:hypothetical protein
MDQVADKVQDAMMGWDLDNQPEDGVAKVPLPPLDPRAFGKAMRPEVVQLLDAVTREINEAPNAVSIAARGPVLSKLLDGWAQRALEVGEKLRVDAAVAELPALNRPHSNWTKKYRRMKAGEGKLAPATDD